MSYLDLLVIIFVALGLLFGLCGKASRKIFKFIFVCLALVGAFLTATTVVDKCSSMKLSEIEFTETIEGEDTTASVVQGLADKLYMIRHPEATEAEMQANALAEFNDTSLQELLWEFLAPNARNEEIATEDLELLGQMYREIPEYKALVDGNLFGIFKIIVFYFTGIIYLIVLPLVGNFIVWLFTLGKRGKRTAKYTFGLFSAVKTALIWAFILLPLAFISPLVKPIAEIALDENTVATISGMSEQYLGKPLTKADIIELIETHYVGNAEGEKGSFIIKAEVGFMEKTDAPIVSVKGEDGEVSVNFFQSIQKLASVSGSGYNLYNFYATGTINVNGEDKLVSEVIAGLGSDLESLSSDINNLNTVVDKIAQIIGDEEEGTGFAPYIRALDNARQGDPEKDQKTFLNGLINGLLKFIMTKVTWSEIPDLPAEDEGEGEGGTTVSQEVISGLLQLAGEVAEGEEQESFDITKLNESVTKVLSTIKPYFEDMTKDADRIAFYDNESINWACPSLLDDIIPRIAQSAIQHFAESDDLASSDLPIDLGSIIGSIKCYTVDDLTGEKEWKFNVIIDQVLGLADAAANALKLVSAFNFDLGGTGGEGGGIDLSDPETVENLTAALESLSELPPEVAETINAVVNEMVESVVSDMLPEGTSFEDLGVPEIDIAQEAATVSALLSNMDALSGAIDETTGQPTVLDEETATSIVEAVTSSAMIETFLQDESTEDMASAVVDQFVTSEESKAALSSALDNMISAQNDIANDPNKSPEEIQAAQELAAKYAQYASLFQTTGGGE